MEAGMEVQVTAFLSFFPAFSYGITSMAMVFINTAVLIQYGYSMTLLALQQLVAALLMHFGKVMGHTKVKVNMTTAKKLLPVSVFYSANVAFALASLKGINIPMYIALKRLTPLAILVVGFFRGKGRPSTQVSFSLILTAVGVIIAALRDLSFDFYGYTMALTSVFFQKFGSSGFFSVFNLFAFPRDSGGRKVRGENSDPKILPLSRRKRVRIATTIRIFHGLLANFPRLKWLPTQILPLLSLVPSPSCLNEASSPCSPVMRIEPQSILHPFAMEHTKLFRHELEVFCMQREGLYFDECSHASSGGREVACGLGKQSPFHQLLATEIAWLQTYGVEEVWSASICSRAIQTPTNDEKHLRYRITLVNNVCPFAAQRRNKTLAYGIEKLIVHLREEWHPPNKVPT